MRAASVAILIIANKSQAREVELLVGKKNGDDIYDTRGLINVKHDE